MQLEGSILNMAHPSERQFVNALLQYIKGNGPLKCIP